MKYGIEMVLQTRILKLDMNTDGTIAIIFTNLTSDLKMTLTLIYESHSHIC